MDVKQVEIWLIDSVTGDMLEQVSAITAPGTVVFADGKNLTEKLNEISLMPGPAATIALGTVTTGTPGSAVTITNTGDEHDAVFDFKIPRGDKGEQGAPFQIKKIYVSIAAMNADFSGTDVAAGEFVMIDTGSIEDQDTSKLYCKGNTAYFFVSDLSGATGIQGPKGDRGDAGAQGARGPQGLTGAQGVQGVKGDTGPTGPKGAQGVKGDTGAVGPQGPKGDKGDQGNPGDRVKVGTTPATAVEHTLFFKVVG